MNCASVRTDRCLAKRLGALFLSMTLALGCVSFPSLQAAYADEDALAPTEEEVAAVEADEGLDPLAGITITTNVTNTSITPSDRQDKTITVTLTGSTQGWDVSLTDYRSRFTTVEVTSATKFKVVVAMDEPSGVIHATVTSREDPSVKAVVNITVKSKPLITDVYLRYNETAFVATPYTTGKQLSDLIQIYAQAPVGANYFVDFSNSNHFSHLCYYTSTGYMSLEDSTEYLVPGRQYYLQLNIEEVDALWPADKNEVTIHVNDLLLSEIPGSDCLWYSASDTGSLNVYLPVQWSDQQAIDLGEYFVERYTPANTSLIYLKNAFMEDSLWVPRFRGKTMLYVPDYQAWCAVIDPTDSWPVPEDFTQIAVASKAEKAQYKVAKPGYQGYGLPGDINGMQGLTIVDGQIAYDAATGAYTISTDLPVRAWLTADVNHDKYLDASDALCIQYALFYGWD